MARRALLIALLCVLAVSVAATTLSDPQSTGAGTGSGADAIEGEAAPQPESPDDGGDAGLRSSAAPSVNLPQLCYPFLRSPWLLGLLAVAAVGAFWAVRRRTDALLATVAVGLPAASIGVPLYVVLTTCSASATPRSSEPSLVAEMAAAADVDAGGAVGSSGVETVVSPVFAVVVVAAVVGVVAFTVYASDDSDVDVRQSPDDADEQAEEPESLAAVGAAAGAAADRIEDAADVDNEVYRAWCEMTTHVNVPNPDAGTPAEFAAAATAAGMADGDVETLTELFRDVRYGGEAATEDREQRAVAALRAIEERYAEGD